MNYTREFFRDTVNYGTRYINSRTYANTRGNKNKSLPRAAFQLVPSRPIPGRSPRQSVPSLRRPMLPATVPHQLASFTLSSKREGCTQKSTILLTSRRNTSFPLAYTQQCSAMFTESVCRSHRGSVVAGDR